MGVTMGCGSSVDPGTEEAAVPSRAYLLAEKLGVKLMAEYRPGFGAGSANDATIDKDEVKEILRKFDQYLEAFATFSDSEGDTSILKLDSATRQLSWHSGGRCHLQDIRVLELTNETIRAPEHQQLTVRLVDPPLGPLRDQLLKDIAIMAKFAGVEHLSGFPDVAAEDPSETAGTEEEMNQAL